MKRSRIICRIMFALALLLLISDIGLASGRKTAKKAQAPKTDSEIVRSGRYQLLSVEHTLNDQINETTALRKELILLDTATGQMQVCSQKIWMNIAVGKEISERKCLPFETYAEFPPGSQKGRKTREGELPRQ